MNKRIFTILIVAIVLVASAISAAAQAEHIQITGACWIVGMGGWDFPGDPDYRYWDTPNGSHWRNQLWLMYCDFSDDRLDSYLVFVDNWNMSWNGGPFLARSFGEVYSSDEQGNKTELWEGHTTAYTDFDWMGATNLVLHGVGDNKGMLIKMTLIPTPEGYYAGEGELLDTGK